MPEHVDLSCAGCCERAQDSWTLRWIRGKKLYKCCSVSCTDWLSRVLKPGTHQADDRPSGSFCSLASFLSVFRTVGWSWSSSFFFWLIQHVESASELVGQSSHLIILIGCSAGELVHEKSAERMCYLAVGCRVSAWCVRATLDPDAADVSQPRRLLSSPLVRRHRLDVYRA